MDWKRFQFESMRRVAASSTVKPARVSRDESLHILKPLGRSHVEKWRRLGINHKIQPSRHQIWEDFGFHAKRDLAGQKVEDSPSEEINTGTDEPASCALFSKSPEQSVRVGV